ncbi:unnamed protein product [Porites lobata]|uniref:Uncharacterized protein n=1 Tax=Porites lobata TaxID=104759 RepID=A0ABN8NQJ1_9CNID|nr:unnamed protein product [Porites lobata]
MSSRCEDGTVTGDFLDELPNFHIDTFSELEEHSGRFAEVSESDVEKFTEGKENATLKKDLLRLKIKYLEYFEGETKTRTREDPRNQPPIKPRMYTNDDAISIDRDPVHVYKMYKEKRPPSMLEPDSSFHLSVNYFKTETHASVEGKNWFKAEPTRVNKLNNIMKDMTQAAGISGKTSNSRRKTLVQKLQDSGDFLLTR